MRRGLRAIWTSATGWALASASHVRQPVANVIRAADEPNGRCPRRRNSLVSLRTLLRRTSSNSSVLLILAFQSTFATGCWAATVVLRGGDSALVGEKVDFELGGVRIFRSGVPTSVPWDRVQGVTDRTLNDAERRQLSIAADLWRARSRAQRGDYQLAGPLFERHFDIFRGTTSETALIVAEGLLRSSIASGREVDRLRAIIPALEAARLRRAGVSTDRYASLPPILDETTLLSTALAPIWEVSPETARAAAEIERLYLSGAAPTPGASLDPETMRVARLYVELLRGQRSGAGAVAATKGDPPAVRFLAALAEVQLAPRPAEGEADEAAAARAQARAALLAVAKELPAWATGWARLAAGRSAVAERDASRRMEGVLQLLSVAALERDVSQSLVVEALRRSAATLHALGERESATIVERELARFGGSTASAPKSAPAAKPSAAPAAAPAKSTATLPARAEPDRSPSRPGATRRIASAP